MVEKDDDIIDRFKDVDHSKEIKHPKTNTNSPSIKKSQNNNYDNFGFHWYPKQSSSSYGAIIGLSVFGFGILFLIGNILMSDIGGIIIGLLMIVFGWLLAGYSASTIKKNDNRYG